MTADATATIAEEIAGGLPADAEMLAATRLYRVARYPATVSLAELEALSADLADAREQVDLLIKLRSGGRKKPPASAIESHQLAESLARLYRSRLS